MRNYKYDNLKFMMIFCVVFGHCLELFQGEISRGIYIFIYTFHMPIFVFISGYFAKCNSKKIIKLTCLYSIWQTIYCLFDKYVLNWDVYIQHIIPNWIIWYLMALIVWTIGIKFFETNSKKTAMALLTVTFILSLIAGFLENVNYIFSISRIITFFPYFLLGYYAKNPNLDFVNLNDKNKKIKSILLMVMLMITAIYFWKIKDVIKPFWLYGSYSYKTAGYNYVFKIMWIILSLCELAILKNIISDKKINIISTIGKNTLLIYLIHGLIIKILTYKISLFNNGEFINILISLLITIIILMALGILIPETLIKIKNRFSNKFKQITS